MKLILKFTIGFLILFNSLTINAQPQSITLTFAARTATFGENVPLDSIRIINRNRSCDTVLYAPDTSFVLYYTVGINKKKLPEKEPFLAGCYPNPAPNGKTFFTIRKQNEGIVHFRLSDLRGNVLTENIQALRAGENRFELKLSKSGIFLLTTYNNRHFETVKVVCNHSSTAVSHITYLSNKKNFKNKTATTGNPWWYEPDDTLWYVGYAKTPQEINGSDVMEDAPQQDTLITLRILEGIPCPSVAAVKYAGHLYPTVQIKERCWLKENLDVGTMISGDTTMTNNGIIEKYCYDNDPVNCEVYGGLYQWDELMQYTTAEKAQGICPDGWYVPTIDEWNAMTQGYTGDDFKEQGHAHWNYGSNGLNTTGFTALPSGGREYNGGTFKLIGKDAPFYTSTKLNPPLWGVYYKEFGMASVMVWGNLHGTEGIALRCIKNQ